MHPGSAAINIDETDNAVLEASELAFRPIVIGVRLQYWAKKIFEWTESPEQAFDFALRLNDKWEIDGRCACQPCSSYML